MKRLLILLLVLILASGCGGKNSSSDSPVITGEVEVTDTTDFYLQAFDTSVIDENTMTYEVIVDKNIVLEDHVLDVAEQHVSQGEVSVVFHDQSKYESLFNVSTVSELKINLTVNLNEPGKYNVQVYPIFGVITTEEMTIQIPLGIHIFIEKDIELNITSVDGELAYEVVNNTDKALSIFDASIRLEKRNGTEWDSVPFADGVGFCANPSSFDENGHYGPIVFESLYDPLESGEYRLSMVVSDDISLRDTKDSSRAYAGFTVDK